MSASGIIITHMHVKDKEKLTKMKDFAVNVTIASISRVHNSW
jgi:hypothetical protein